MVAAPHVALASPGAGDELIAFRLLRFLRENDMKRSMIRPAAVLAIERLKIASKGLPKEKVSLALNLACEGKPGELGRPATVTITANGRKLGNGQSPKTDR
jgi:hypothetical protein